MQSLFNESIALMQFLSNLGPQKMSMSFGVHVVGWPFSTHKRKEPVSTAWSPSMAKMWSASKPNDSIALYTPSATIWLATSPSIVNFVANFTMNFAMNFAMNFGYQKKTRHEKVKCTSFVVVHIPKTPETLKTFLLKW